MAQRAYNEPGITFNHNNVTFNDGPYVVPKPEDVTDPPFNDPWKNRHNRRYKWKHGLLGKSYLER